VSSSHLPLTQATVAEGYREPPSFTDLLPWVEYNPVRNSIVLEDGVSVGAWLELSVIGTEARSSDYLRELRDNVQAILTDAIPEEDNPWVLQVYVQDEPDLAPFSQSLYDYPIDALRQSAFTRHHLAVMTAHLKQISKPGGLFVDEAVTGSSWRAKIRRVRAVLYRRQAKERRHDHCADDELDDVCSKLVAAFASTGIPATRKDGKAFYQWLLNWLNPPEASENHDGQSITDLAPYPGDENLPFGYEFAEQLCLSTPRSSDGTWWFNKQPHSVLTVQSLRRAPDVGHLTAERCAGDQVFALFDRLPEHTVMALTLTVKPQHEVRDQIARVRRSAVGDSAESIMTREEADAAEREMVSGNHLYPLDIAFYLRAESLSQLRSNENRINSMLLPNGLQTIRSTADALRLDSYIRYLPMAYDVALDKRRRRSRLVFSSHAANLLPVYGRARGTGNPGLVFFNRGAEPLVFDPLNPSDRKKNAHALILGPTGAGKSAMLVYLLQQMLATYRPRVFIIEAGASFDLFAQHLQHHGLTVNQVILNPGTDISLPPFADAIRLVETRQSVDIDPCTDADDDDAHRDILGEMEIAARIMITGGDEREDARMTRADRLMMRQAIYKAASKARSENRSMVLTENVVSALRQLGCDAALAIERRSRAIEMADGMALFCSGLAGRFFNRAGGSWPEVDVTLLDMGLLAREGYEDQLTVAYLSIMSHINALVERRQHDQRPTLVVTDEGHIITTNPQLSRYVVKITKMWRKLGAWFWIATQNLEDFPDASRRMLNMMEWWLCLVMPKQEVDQIARFKDLSDEQRRLLLSTRKEPGKFTEGVVLSDSIEALFRNVPPPLSLALAMTEKQEKAERAAIMRDLACSELEAAYVVAERLARQNNSKA
jgi:conjugative transfer ATPase